MHMTMVTMIESKFAIGQKHTSMHSKPLATPKDNRTDFLRILIIGNSGAGKSWLADRLAEKYGSPHIDLDSLHWLGAGYNEARERSEAIALVKSAASQARWTIEGIYGWLVSEIAANATALIWLCPDEEACIKNIQQRGRRGNASEQSFSDLLDWAKTYRLRTGSSSFGVHQRIFEDFAGTKYLFRERIEVTRFLDR
ncbi:UNVERIFIED_ORG: adenylate kinase family enzyme [Herbaspirillum seropedicae]